MKVGIRQNTNITTAVVICLDSALGGLDTLGAVQTRMEQGTCKYKLINGASNVQPITRMTYSCNPNKFLGIPNPIGNSLVRGTEDSNPDEVAYVKIAATPLQAGAVSISCFIELEFIAVWTEPQNGPSS